MHQKSGLLITYKEFLEKVPEKLRSEAINLYTRSNFIRIFISSICFLVISILSLVFTITNDFINKSPSTIDFMNLIALSALGVCSIVIIICGLRDYKRPLSIKIYNICHCFYYFAVDAVLAVLIFGQFFIGNTIMYAQFYWLFFAAAPLLHLKSNIINISFNALVYIVEYVAMMFVHNSTIYSFTYFIPVLLIFGVFGLYLRNYYLSNIIYTLQNRELNKQLEQRSRIDSLTGCLNRYVMNERYEFYRNNVNKLTVIMFDIDNFKEYNDGFTHVKGDECLKSISKCVQTLCNDRHADLFRYGGEEFVIFSTESSVNQSLDFAHSIVVGVSSLKIPMPDNCNSPLPHVTVSLGMTIEQVSRDVSMKDIISEADRRLYIAKREGKNRVCFFGPEDKDPVPVLHSNK